MYDFLLREEKYEELINLFEGFLGGYRKHYANKGQIAFDCPQCSAEKGVIRDGKGNLEINYKKGKFNCWACGEDSGTHGSVFSLIKSYGGSDLLDRYKQLGIVYTYENEDGEEIEFTQKEWLKLPAEYNPLHNAPEIGLNVKFFNYLYKRRITPEMIEKFKIGYIISGRYKNRVVIPSYDEFGDLNYFVTRSIYEPKHFKYINSEVPKMKIVFNENLIDWSKTIFLVEGPFDHLVLPNSIPLLGKQLSDLLFGKLYNKAEKDIVIILDPDAWKSNVKLYNKLDGGRLRGRIKTVKTPLDIDISKYNQLYGSEALFSYIRQNRIRLID